MNNKYRFVFDALMVSLCRVPSNSGSVNINLGARSMNINLGARSMNINLGASLAPLPRYLLGCDFKVVLITLLTFAFALPVKAENIEQLSQLLRTKQCQFCDLSNAGLVFANLTGANLSGANLAGANLSQANLTGANLSGANLSGTSFNSANLTGANLNGAIVNGADLRGAYLTNVSLVGTSMDTAYVQGAIGMPNNAGSPEMFYGWGLLEAQKGNYKAALTNYDKALAIDPNFAQGYLGRGLAFLRLGNENSAKQNVEYAAKLFQEQKNADGYETAQNFLKNLEAVQTARNNNGGSSPQLDGIIRGVASLALQFLLKGAKMPF